VLLNVVFHVTGEVLLYLSVLVLECVVDFDILWFCLSGCFMSVEAEWFGLSFVFLEKLFGIFGRVCLASGVLMVRMLFFWTLLLREIQDNLHILIVMYEKQNVYIT